MGGKNINIIIKRQEKGKMGAKGNLTICLFCGQIEERNARETTFVRCGKCQEEGRTEMMDLKAFLERKREMLSLMRRG